MRNIRTALFCALVNFRRWYKNPTISLLAVLWITFFVIEVTLDTSIFCLQNGYVITPWMLPFCFSSDYVLLVYGMVVVLLFAQAPFCDTLVPFTMIRTGKRTWFWGQIVYIITASLVLVLGTCACMWLTFAPCMSYSPEWGGVLEGLGEGNVSGYSGGFFGVQMSILRNYEPLEATIFTMLLLWLLAVLIGMTVLLFNVVARPGIGPAVAAIIACWSDYATAFQRGRQFGTWIFKTSIFQWGSLSAMAPVITRGISLSGAVWTEIVLVVVFIVVSACVFCKRDTLFTQNKM
jgi:hypothetical protein